MCVYDKGINHFERRIVRKVCSRPDLYTLPNYDNPVLRGIIRQNMQEAKNSKFVAQLSENELRKLGEEPLDTDTIEKLNLASIDGSFARLIQPLRNGDGLTEENLNILFKFLVLARFRSPVWREVYYPKFYKNVNDMLAPFFKSIQNNMSDSSKSLQDEFDRSLYQLTIYQQCQNSTTALHKVSARILVLHAQERVKFVLSDNPGRAYYPSRLKYLSDEGFPGIKEPDAQIAYPIAPDTCLIVTANHAIPFFSHSAATADEIKHINTALALIAHEEVVFPGPHISGFDSWLNINKIKPLRNP